MQADARDQSDGNPAGALASPPRGPAGAAARAPGGEPLRLGQPTTAMRMSVGDYPGMRSSRESMISAARRASAMIVICGLTPRDDGTALPSVTYRPGVSCAS